MALTDVQPDQRTQVERVTDGICEKMAAVCSHADTVMLQIRNGVRDVGKANVAAELEKREAGLSAKLQTTYNALKQAVQTGKDTTIEDMPE